MSLAPPGSSSLNGWTCLSSPDWSDRRLTTKLIPGTRLKMLVRKDTGPLFLALAADYHLWSRLYTAECYDARTARMASGFSDHYSATAIDLNGNREGAMGMANYKWWKQTSKRNFANALLDKYQIVSWGGSVDFGGSYTNGSYTDWMHWYLSDGTTLSDVQAVIEDLKIDSRGYQNGRVAGL